MQKKFEKIKKQEKALEINTKARDKMFKAKLKQLKRDTDQVLIQYKICEEKEQLVDEEIERQEAYLAELMQHPKLKDYNVQQILMQVTLSTQGKFTSKGFKSSKNKRKSEYNQSQKSGRQNRRP